MTVEPWQSKLVVGSRIVLITIVLLVAGFWGALWWDIRQSYMNYEQLEACLKRHQLKPKNGWKHKDLSLEDFGWEFQLMDGRVAGLNVYDGNQARYCTHRIDGVRLVTKDHRRRDYISFNHPDLIAELGGQTLETMEDLIENIESVVRWIEANPSAQTAEENIKNPRRYTNLILP